MSPELEQTLSMLSSHRSVLGYMLVTRGHHPSIIRHSGVVFEGEQGKRYAAVVARIVESVQAGLEEVRIDDGLTAAATGETDVVRVWFLFFFFRRRALFLENSNNIFCILFLQKDEIRFMRIRTKKHEILISPGEL